jgi:oxygen-independent coproporphyrinogen III oxidase
MVSPRHVYLHVPFCARRCSYCDFAVAAVREPPAAAWLAAITAELTVHQLEQGWQRLEPLTIYVGGGTPSLLGAGALPELRARLERCMSLADVAEWTAEANPESLTTELAHDWAVAGVNRISLGVQTFHEPALRWMGRLHGSAGPVRAMQAARTAGIGNISVDLIFGLPARLERDWTTDLERALELEPEHISLYGLTAEPATPLGRWVADGRERLADEERYEAEFLEAVDRLSSAGYEQYELSNFARPGRESRHNRAYWEGVPYLGLGPGAHSFLPPRRFWNVRDWNEYRLRMAARESAVAGHEEIEAEAAELEGLWLGLRTDRGVPMQELSAAQRTLAAGWQEAGHAVLSDGRLRLTPRGWLLLDRFTVELAAASHATTVASRA